MTVVLRASDDNHLATLPQAARAAVREIDPNQPVHEVSTVGAVVDRSLWQWRFFGTLFWLAGGLALLLALVGVYGVMPYTVSQRGRELGLRMALGASTQDVISMVLREGGSLILAGIALGLPLSAALGSVLSSVLFGVEPFEPLTLGAVSSFWSQCR
jgi:putative ABC transport system permease protein